MEEFFLLLNPCSLNSELKRLGSISFIKKAGIKKNKVWVPYALRIMQAFYFMTYIDSKGHRRLMEMDVWTRVIMPQFFDEELQKIILDDETYGILTGLEILHKQLTMLNVFFVGVQMFKNEVELLNL